jgi:glycosyltransferase involved in cell wall biosynthesis
MRILFFIESLRSGGKERRLLELIHYLGQDADNEMLLVITEDEIHYKHVYDLPVIIRVIKRKGLKKDPRLFFKFYRLCNEFNPDIIHSWGSMLAFYSLPAIIIKRIPHINSHIADAPLNRKKYGFHAIITNLGFKFSRIILANSYAGLQNYGVSGGKCRVIYNGIRLERFSDLPDKESIKAKFNIRTEYTVIMVASFTINKKYGQFLDIAEYFSGRRNDITFFGVGDTEEDSTEFEKIRTRSEKMGNVILCKKIESVEALVNACDIGVLFTHSEGLSNSIIEYMACCKPVIASDAGGTRELIENNTTGFLITDETSEEIARLISELLDDTERRSTIGRNARLHIEENFSIDRMGAEFDRLYKEIAGLSGISFKKINI